MSDTRAAMREFRFLDDKRRQGGLSPFEEQRWVELRQELGLPDEPAECHAQAAYDPNAAVMGYYAEDGNWYPYTQEQLDALAQQGYFAEDGNWYPYTQEQLAAWAQQQGYDPNAYAAYAQQQGYDPNAYPAGADPAGALPEAPPPVAPVNDLT